MKIEIESLEKSFGQSKAVQNVSATINSGELICILGPSGCGKTTTLNMVAGIIEPTSGRILFDGVDVTNQPAEKRNIGFVFQNYALYPHLSVEKNIEFPLVISKTPRKERQERVREVADLVQVNQHLPKRPAQLSGGQQQRVAIARALVKQPDLLLLDEPLSNLDAKLRLEMRNELRRIQTRTGVTTVFVTHDQDEAMSIADRTMVMNEGKIVQYAPPEELYDSPEDLFVAQFLGHPPMNIIHGSIQNGDLFFGEDVIKGIRPKGDLPEVKVGIRAEAIHLDTSVPNCVVEDVNHLGRDVGLSLSFHGRLIQAVVSRREAREVKVDDRIAISVDPAGCHLFDAKSGDRIG